MAAALKAVEEGVSLTRASRDFGVPRSTLHDRVSGRVVDGVKPGPKPYLDETDEKELSSYLKHCAKVGYEKTRKDVQGRSHRGGRSGHCRPNIAYLTLY